MLPRRNRRVAAAAAGGSRRLRTARPAATRSAGLAASAAAREGAAADRPSAGTAAGSLRNHNVGKPAVKFVNRAIIKISLWRLFFNLYCVFF